MKITGVGGGTPRLGSVDGSGMELYSTGTQTTYSFYTPVTYPALASRPALFEERVSISVRMEVPARPATTVTSLPVLPARTVSIELCTVYVGRMTVVNVTGMGGYFEVKP